MNDIEQRDDRLRIAEELFASYRQDHAAGILDARLRWKEIDEEVLKITKSWADSASQELTDPDPASLFGAAGYDWAFFVDAQTTLGFHQVLTAIAEHKGDPPASEMLKRYALDILRGRVHLIGAIRLVATDKPLLTNLPNVFQTFVPGMDPRKYPVLEQTVRVVAAAALPRRELYRSRGIESDGEPETEELDDQRLDEIREQYKELISEADQSGLDHDATREEEVLVKALEVAGLSPEPDDDIEALQRILLLAERVPVSQESIRRCANAVELLVSQGHHTVAVARCAASLGNLIARQEAMAEFADMLVRIGSRLLEPELDIETRRPLTTIVAHAWAKLGRKDRARALLHELDQKTIPPEERLRLSLMEAETLEEKDPNKAADVLLKALDSIREADPLRRLPALHKLVSLWPVKRESAMLQPFADELVDISNTLPEPRRTLSLARATLRLWGIGLKARAMRGWSMIDADHVRRSVPPVMAKKVLSILEKARKKLDVSSADTVVG